MLKIVKMYHIKEAVMKVGSPSYECEEIGDVVTVALLKKEVELTSFLRRIFRKDHKNTHIKNSGPDGI